MRLRSIGIILAAAACTAACSSGASHPAATQTAAAPALPTKAVPSAALTAWWAANGQRAEAINNDALALKNDGVGAASGKQIEADCKKFVTAVTAADKVPNPPDSAATEDWQTGMKAFAQVSSWCGQAQDANTQTLLVSIVGGSQPDVEQMMLRLAQLGVPTAS